MEGLRIAVVSHDYPTEQSHGGAFVQARVDLYRKMGHQVDVFSRRISSPQSSPTKAGYDVIAAHYPLPEFVIPKALSLAEATPIVAYLHGAESIRRGFPTPYRLRVKREVSRFLPRCRARVVPSKWMAEKVMEYIGFGSTVIPNPIDPGLFRLAPAPQEIRGLCLRGTANKYGVDVLRKALRHLPSEAKVTILEPKYARSDLPALLSKYSYFIAPSRVEAQGLMMCEAMATGMPVITTRAGCIPEFVTNGDGIFIDELTPNGVATAIQAMHRRLPLDSGSREGIRRRILERCGPAVTVEKDIALFAGLG